MYGFSKLPEAITVAVKELLSLCSETKRFNPKLLNTICEFKYKDFNKDTFSSFATLETLAVIEAASVDFLFCKLNSRDAESKIPLFMFHKPCAEPLSVEKISE